MKYWRLNYGSDSVLDRMISDSAVICSDKDFALSLSVGDGIVLARFDECSQTGQVKAIGRVNSISRPSGNPLVQWKRVSETLYPTVQGQKFWRQLKPYFGFATTVAKRYRLEDMFTRHLPSSLKPSLPESSPLNESDTSTGGYVYFIRSQYGYKIGKTKRMKDRAQLFSVKLPFPIEIVHFSWFDDYSAAERHFHHLFKDKRLDGEWFNLTEADLNSIKRMYQLGSGCTSSISRGFS